MHCNIGCISVKVNNLMNTITVCENGNCNKFKISYKSEKRGVWFYVAERFTNDTLGQEQLLLTMSGKTIYLYKRSKVERLIRIPMSHNLIK
jgi:hypothetical protein